MENKMKRKKGYFILLTLTILFTLAALVTVFPVSSASRVCLAGYKAHCTFVPVSTIICLILAGTVCKIRSSFFRERKK
jgi:Na+-transporting NADH:ubiquinone oxidoreductase subunit NqrE